MHVKLLFSMSLQHLFLLFVVTFPLASATQNQSRRQRMENSKVSLQNDLKTYHNNYLMWRTTYIKHWRMLFNLYLLIFIYEILHSHKPYHFSESQPWVNVIINQKYWLRDFLTQIQQKYNEWWTMILKYFFTKYWNSRNTNVWDWQIW